MGATKKNAKAALVTGATGLIGSRLTRSLLERGRRLALLCRPASTRRLDSWLDRLPAGIDRPRVVIGDLEQPLLGLTSEDLTWLRAEATEVFHLGAAYSLSMDAEQAQRTNVGGTRNVLELAASLPRLSRFHHVSSMVVSGDFTGTYGESDFDLGQGFFHAYGQSKFDSEKLVRDSGLPATVYRPGAVVGDSRTGEMDKIDGPYFAFAALHALRKLPGVTRLPMIVPRGDEVKFHIVPVDYVVAALDHLAALPADGLKTYHLTDPAPVSFRQFYLATLEAMGFSGPTIARPVQRLARLLLRPGLWPITRRAGRAMGMPAEMLGHLLYAVHYDTARASADLAGSPISCPSILEILPTLVDYYERHLA